MGSNTKDSPTITIPKSSGVKKMREMAVDWMEKNAKGINFGIIVEIKRDGKKFLDFYPRVNQPCYGELRKYKKSHSDYTDPKKYDGKSDDYRPSDLYHPFPDGTPITIIVGHSSDALKADSPIIALVLGKDSPWKAGIGKKIEVIQGEKNTLLVFDDTNFDSTIFVSALNNLKATIQNPHFEKMISQGIDPKVAFLLIFSTMEDYPPIKDYTTFAEDVKSGKIKMLLKPYMQRSYYLPVHIDVGRFMTGETLDVTGGTMRDRFDYNRNRLQDVFLDTSKDGTPDPYQKKIFTDLEIVIEETLSEFPAEERSVGNTILMKAIEEAVINLGLRQSNLLEAERLASEAMAEAA